MNERYEVIVVGGGQAGLAIGYHLAQQGRRFTILEAADEPAAAWRSRWDSLTLFTPTGYSSLPGLAFPGDPDSYPSRDQVVDYLTDYAERFDLPVGLSSRVRAVRAAQGGGYVIETDHRAYDAYQVVVATGPFQVPRVPAFAKALHRDVVQFHSSEYRSPDTLPPGPVLVVGGGNTGFQIAAELSTSHEVELAIGTRQMSLPQRLFGRELFRWLEATGLMGTTVTSRLGRRMKDRDVLIGSSPRALRRGYGVELRPRATDATATEVIFSDGTRLVPSTVIWATGFGRDHSWVHLPVFDEREDLVHERGVTSAPGLYFLGLPWMHSRGSALLGWVGQDAEHLAGRIDAFEAEAQAPVKKTPEASAPAPR